MKKLMIVAVVLMLSGCSAGTNPPAADQADPAGPYVQCDGKVMNGQCGKPK